MTEIIEFEGVEYRKVKRKAEIGDLITYSFNGNYNDTPRKVIEVGVNGPLFNAHLDADDEETIGYAHDAYDVLEPIEDESPRTESYLLANLALRVSDIERALSPKNYADVGPANETPVGNEVGADTTQAKRIEAVCNEVRDLLIRKNHDYGDSFSKQYAKYGVLSGLIRMDDKMARLDTLINGEQAQVAESVEDSLLDLIGYATLTLVERRKEASE